jgi:hypothetical protein
MMELPGELFLFNLSLLAITFSAVSALVTLLRHSMGGKLSNFDVFLVNADVSHGFVVAISSVLPPLVAQSRLSEPLVWIIASGMAAVFLGRGRGKHHAATRYSYQGSDALSNPDCVLPALVWRLAPACKRCASGSPGNLSL